MYVKLHKRIVTGILIAIFSAVFMSNVSTMSLKTRSSNTFQAESQFAAEDYLTTAKRIVDKWIQATLTRPLGGGLDQDGPLQTLCLYHEMLISDEPEPTPDSYIQLAEWERSVASVLPRLSDFTGNPTYREAAQNSIHGMFTLVMDQICETTDYLFPMGDGGAWNGFTDLLNADACSDFTENEIPAVELYSLAPTDNDRDNILNWLDALYTWHTKDDGRFLPGVALAPPHIGGGGFFQLKHGIMMHLLCQAYSLTGDLKFLQRLESMATWLNENMKGATGILHGWGSDLYILPASHEGQGGYAYGYARGLGRCLKLVNSPIILNLTRQHMDGLIQHGFDYYKNAWYAVVNTNTGEATGYPDLFTGMYNNLGFLDFYEVTGDLKYLDVVNRSVLAVANSTFHFPAHNQPSLIEQLIELYYVTRKPTLLEKAKYQADNLCSFAEQNKYWMPSHNSNPTKVDEDNPFHAAKALLDIYEAIVQPPPPTCKLSVQSAPTASMQFTLDSLFYLTPYSTVLSKGNYTVAMPLMATVDSTSFSFVMWEDNSTDPIRNINLTSDIVITAYYEVAPSIYSVTFQSSPIDAVQVTLDEVLIGQTPITETVAEGRHLISVPQEVTVGESTYAFMNWGDGVTTPTRTCNITQDTVLMVFYGWNDETGPTIQYIFQNPLPHSVNYSDIVQINATVTDVSRVKLVILSYTTNSITWIDVNMTEIETDLYSAQIGPFSEDSTVTYEITAEDNFGNISTADNYQFIVVPEFSSFLVVTLFLIAALLAVTIHKRKPLYSARE